MKRRLFLSMPGVALVTCATPVAAIDGETDILRLFREHRAILDAAGKHVCAADFAAKVIVDTNRGDIFSDWETGAIWQEARALTGSAA